MRSGTSRRNKEFEIISVYFFVIFSQNFAVFCALCIEHDMSKYASITLSFDHFHFHPTAQLVPDLILTLCQTKIAERESFYHGTRETFSFSLSSGSGLMRFYDKNEQVTNVLDLWTIT